MGKGPSVPQSLDSPRPIAKVRLARDCLAYFMNIPPTEGFLFTLASSNSPQFTNASANYIHLENFAGFNQDN